VKWSSAARMITFHRLAVVDDFWIHQQRV
jgi:hypothetical protein